MLTRAQEKLIRSLHTKKGRKESGQCLVEGKKFIEAAGASVEFTFTPEDTDVFDTLITTETPQDIAAVAQAPSFTLEDVSSKPTILVLDGVQDPGNVGSALRSCQAFNTSLILIESADPTSSKVIRSSAGAVFNTPWISVPRNEARAMIEALKRPVYRLEKTEEAEDIGFIQNTNPSVVIAGSEGTGIHLDIPGTSVAIKHEPLLESMNVGNAIAIALYLRFSA